MRLPRMGIRRKGEVVADQTEFGTDRSAGIHGKPSGLGGCYRGRRVKPEVHSALQICRRRLHGISGLISPGGAGTVVLHNEPSQRILASS